MTERVSILGVDIDTFSLQETVKQAAAFINCHKPSLIITANAEMVMQAQTDLELASILKRADLVTPDGAGVVWAAQRQGVTISRVTGVDLTYALLDLAAVNSKAVYFLGGAPGVAAAAANNVLSSYPGIVIAGHHHGFFSSAEQPEVIGKIKQSGADILFVAFGVPKQEKWLNEYLTTLNIPLSLGVGGSLDILAGNTKRAPLWMQNNKLEWLYRLLCQPSRVGRMLALPRFAYQVIFKKNH